MQIVEKYYGKEIFYEDAFNEVAEEAQEEKTRKEIVIFLTCLLRHLLISCILLILGFYLN